MNKKLWLTIYPLAIMLGLGSAEHAVAATEYTPDAPCTDCQTKGNTPADQDSDSSYDNNTFDNSSEQRSESAKKPVDNAKTQNIDDNINSSDDEDED